MKTAFLLAAIAAIIVQPGTLKAKWEFAAAGPAAPSPDTDSGGALVGKVSFTGQSPQGRKIDMAADPQCGNSHATSEELVAGPGNALANVVVFVSSGLEKRPYEPPQDPVVIEQKGCQYHGHVVAMEAGQKLLVKNSDPTTHNIHPLPQNNREWNQSQAQGVPPIEASFAREEIAIPVKCNIHPWMKGYIAVFKHPYFAVTDKEGSFVLKGLPPGTYTITAWQEKLGTLNQNVTVGAKEEKKVEFVFQGQ